MPMPAAKIPPPTDPQAGEFATLIAAGVPPGDALSYFLPDEDDAAQLRAWAGQWLRTRNVRAAQVTIQGGKNWAQLTPAERRDQALVKHENELAYLLQVESYAEADKAKQAKMDIARDVLQRAKAGPRATSPVEEFLKGFEAAQRAKAGATAPPSPVVN